MPRRSSGAPRSIIRTISFRTENLLCEKFLRFRFHFLFLFVSRNANAASVAGNEI